MTAIFAPTATLAILLGLRAVFGSLRVGEEAEFEGLDLAEHSESAYVFGAASGSQSMHPSSSAQGAGAPSFAAARESVI